MYLALASYVANDDTIVQNDAQADAVLPLMETLFLQQGFTEASSETPFEDYLVMGPGKAPMVMVYESQFLSRAAMPNGGVGQNMVLLYPEPTIFTKHILLPITEGGERLGEALTTDPELQRLAIEYGFRNNNTAYFQEWIDQHGIQVPMNLVNVVEPPSYEVLEGMIQQIEQKYTTGGLTDD